jgi:glyoxylase-like metal-dependent hydrolase (beta-lactamase superfamily II)
MGKEAVSSGEEALPRIRCVLAPNSSMMTQTGTNTYIVGSGRVAVIDPGPAIAAHQAAILAALSPGESISNIFVTHAHLDHSGLAASLASATDAAIYGFGPAGAGRSVTMRRLADKLPISGSEGVDHGFQPDISMADGDYVDGENWRLTALHTPGHMGNHLCFAVEDLLFSGDHVMGWSTSLVSPPDGDMTDYMASLAKLQARQWRRFLPGHGDPIRNPERRLIDLLAHRHAREAALLVALADGATDIATLTSVVYPDLAVPLIPAAYRNILAHLIDLEGRNLIRATPYPLPDAMFALV